ncbi:hypothetical protein [Rhodoferax aquaticus]|uniref:Uncharacterized protein n=1 Tax=Rhodoferax aquaticus TaxID=2527691 RepID=A0A515EQG2_9BURK|nr:hypothetical protein [Rhodoferax aquaticus]QDL54918.1 hypothetical protein EXZ61_12510 [Rhodoferax aquaticus]
MPTITASYARPTPQAMMDKARLEQAKRDADQAEATAQNLRAQADAAEMDAQKNHDQVRDLSSRIRRADATYSAPSGKPSEVPQKTQNFLEDMYTATSAKFAASGNPLKADALSSPVVNNQGQATGRIVNLKA